MNVLIAGNAARRNDIDRALSWAAANGAPEVDRIEINGCIIARAYLTSSSTASRWSASAGAVATTIGVATMSTSDIVGNRPVPGGTVGIGSDGGQVYAVTGAGNQRLFQHLADDGALFSTHVGALAAALGADVELDRSLEDFVLGFGFLPDRLTPFRGIRALPAPGRFDVSTGLPTGEASAVSHDVEPQPHPNLAELVCEIVDEQAGDARSHAVLLGGFDSALVAAALHSVGRDVMTFTFDFNEAGFAQRNVDPVVKAARATHHPVMITPDVLGDALLTLPARLNQPSPQPHYQLQTILAAEQARDCGADVIFTGDGCDALFAAYPTINTRAAAGNAASKIPLPMRRALLSGLGVGAVERRLGHVARVSRSALLASMLDGPAAHHLPTQYLDRVALDRLRSGESVPQSESIESIRQRLGEASGLTDPARLAVNGNALTGQSSSKVEGAVARSGLSVLSPFTHPRFRAAVAALPEAEQRPSGSLAAAEGKPALQQGAFDAGLLPHGVIYQPKQSPTEAPVDQWYANELRPVVDELFAHLPFAISASEIDNLVRPKWAENAYRSKLTLSKHAYQAVGLLASYAAFTRLAT